MMQANLLVFDVGSTFTKVAAFHFAANELDFLGRAQSSTTVDNIETGLNLARQSLAEAGIQVAQEHQIFSTSSAAGGLRMVALGYMPRVTAKAAKEVAMSAGARVLEIISSEDPPEYRLQVLMEIQPDIVLLAGGTDGGDTDSLIGNARIIVQARGKAVVILAGNKEAQMEAAEILSAGGIGHIRVPNVMPTIHELKVKPAREAIHEQFIRQITRAKGLNKLLDIVSNRKVTPTPGAVLMGAELLAKGTYEQEGVGDVLVVDIGGATTDIHSVLPELDKLTIEEKGLVVTNEKQSSYRTVEGNLGLRISATGIVETIGPAGVLAKIGRKGEAAVEELTDYVNYLEKNPEHISLTERDKSFDLALATGAIEVALKRHAGYISQEFNPVMGIVPGTPIGRDLRRVAYVFAVGGIFTHSDPDDRQFILEQAFKNPGISLLPVKPQFIVDKNYLMFAVGALSQQFPDAALQFAKQQFGLISGGESKK
jgi:uncharacterized protein (TIGR01319 family)